MFFVFFSSFQLEGHLEVKHNLEIAEPRLFPELDNQNLLYVIIIYLIETV